MSDFLFMLFAVVLLAVSIVFVSVCQRLMRQ